QANLRYVFPANLTVASGSTLGVAAGASALVRDNATLTVSGALNVGAAGGAPVAGAGGDFFNNDAQGVAVANGGSHGLANARLPRSTGTNNGINTSSIQVAANGQLTASSSLFALDTVTLNSGCTATIQYAALVTQFAINWGTNGASLAIAQ